MTENYIMIDLDDERTVGIADVISNKTCKKILELIAERELSEGDISKELKIPLNTVEYNLNKLVDSGLVEKAKNFFWSAKGKKINVYRVSNKKIVISPRRILRGIMPAALMSVVIAFGIKIYYDGLKAIGTSGVADKVAETVPNSGLAESAAGIASNVSYSGSAIPEYWAWFLLGALCALLIYAVWNWRGLK